MAGNNGNLSRRGLKRLGRAGTSFLLMLAGRQAWFLLIGIFVVLSLWLLYNNVWYELQQEAGLPQSVVGGGVLEINAEALRSINTRRPDRVERTKHDYRIYDRLFTVP
ncbi:MAG: hypothetical protein ABIH36_01830 [bacterium]